MPVIKVILFLLIVFLSHSLCAQDFSKGNITKKDGSIENGFIRITSREINHRSIEFRPETSETSKIYLPFEILGFEIEGLGSYKSFNTRIFASTYENDTTEILFLKKLTKAPLIIYEYFHTNSKEFFYVEKEGDLYPLIYREELVLQDHKEFLQKTEFYKPTLIQLTQDCKKFKTDFISEIEYLKKDILTVATLYNQCRDVNYKQPFDITRVDEFFSGKIFITKDSIINGLIQFKGEDYYGNEVSFKNSDKGDILVYSTNSIYAYQIDNYVYYQSAQVDFKRFGFSSKGNTKVFLKELISGTAKLYEYKYNNYTRLFFLGKDENIYPLIVRQEQVTDQTGTYNSVKDFYKYSLKQLFSDCEFLEEKEINGTKYNRRHLSSLIANYNNCGPNNKGKGLDNSNSSSQYYFGGLMGVNLVSPNNVITGGIFSKTFKDTPGLFLTLKIDYTNFNDDFNGEAFNTKLTKLGLGLRKTLYNANIKPYFGLGLDYLILNIITENRVEFRDRTFSVAPALGVMFVDKILISVDYSLNLLLAEGDRSPDINTVAISFSIGL